MDKEKQHINEALLMSYLLREADSQQVDEVELWLSLSDDNAAYLKSMELLWIETGKLTPPPVAVDTVKAWKTISDKLNFGSEKELTQKKPFFNRFKTVWQAAAAVLIIVGAFSIFKWLTAEADTITWASTNDIVSDTLTDGSIISLNTNSTLYYPEEFNKRVRKVKLEGEAFFDVKHDEKQPFIIELNGANIKVLGTSFNVKEIPEEQLVEVYVQSGIVELYSVSEERDSTSVILQKGDKGVLNTRTGIARKQLDEGMNANELTWLNNTFVFDGVRLEYVAEFLENYFEINIEFEQDSIKDRLYTATFSNDNIEDIITVIAGTYDLEVKIENETFILHEPSN